MNERFEHLYIPYRTYVVKHLAHLPHPASHVHLCWTCEVQHLFAQTPNYGTL